MSRMRPYGVTPAIGLLEQHRSIGGGGDGRGFGDQVDAVRRSAASFGHQHASYTPLSRCERQHFEANF